MIRFSPDLREVSGEHARTPVSPWLCARCLVGWEPELLGTHLLQ